MKKERFKPDWPIIGNIPITDFLEKSVNQPADKQDNQRIQGTYIFAGPEYLGKFNAAVYFAKSLLCQNVHSGEKDFPCGACASCNILRNGQIDGHGDFFVLSREEDKKNISIEQVRDFITKLNMSSFGGFYKVGIINIAEKLSEKALNALLKTLEEPKKNTILILVTHDIDSLPKTILSRSQILNFKLVKQADIYDYLFHKCHATRDDAKKFSRICIGRPRLAVKLMEDADALSAHEKKVDIFFNFFHQDINNRMLAISELLPNKTVGQNLASLAFDILQVWNGAIRDMLLFDCGCGSITQNEVFLSRIQTINLSSKRILKLNQSIKDGLEALSANVNPRLVLENIAINII